MENTDFKAASGLTIKTKNDYSSLREEKYGYPYSIEFDNACIIATIKAEKLFLQTTSTTPHGTTLGAKRRVTSKIPPFKSPSTTNS